FSFFFSSRRRHTRFSRDWSSDVCSSDLVRNTGTLPLEELEFSAKTPSQWTATFQPSDIQRLEAGESQEVTATLSVPDKTIAGDYLTTFTARNDDTNAETTFRMTVKNSLLYGWIGILVILAAYAQVN